MNYGAGSYFNNIVTYSGSGIFRIYGDVTYANKYENNNSSSAYEVNTHLYNRGGNDVEVNPVGTGGIHFLSGSELTVQDGKTLFIYGNNTLTMDGAISESNGSAKLTIQNSATVYLNSNCSYTGNTTLNGGTLYLAASADNTLPAANTVTVNGGTLYISRNQTLANLNVNGGNVVVSPGVTLTVTGTINNNSTITVNGTLRVNQATTIIGNAITYGTGSTLTYGGPGNQTASDKEFPAVNGPANLSIATGASLSIPTSFERTIAGNVNIAAGGSFYIGSQFTLGGDMTNNGTFTSGLVTLVFGGSGAQNWNDGNSNTYVYVAVNNTGSGVQINNSITIGALNLAAGELKINGNTLTITATIAGTGTITGSPSSNLILASSAGTLNFTQTSALTRSLNNLTLNNDASATLGTALDVYGTVTLSNSVATLDLANKNLTLKSNATNTARIAALASDGSNLTNATNVTMERFIPARGGNPASGGRAYRLLAPTVTTSGSIRTNWMEGGMNIGIGINDDPNPGYGTHITGIGGNSNGFDKTQSNAASLYATTNGVSPTYTAYTSTNGTLNAMTGYFLYIRGDRSVSTTIPLAPGMPTSATTLRANGNLQKGVKTFSGISTTPSALSLVTNPYPSAIDWASIYASNSATDIGPAYTLWDPNQGTRGGFVTVSNTGVVVPPSSGATQYIQSGQAFFVQTVTGTGTGFTLQESHKVANSSNLVFRPGLPNVQPENFSVSLYYFEPTGFRRLADGATAVFGNYSKAIDKYDAMEINNWDENIAIAREGKHLALESRPVITDKDELPLFMNNMKQQKYEFDFVPTNFSNKYLTATLIDNYLGTKTMLSVNDPVTVSFEVNSDPRSATSDRFVVVFGEDTKLNTTVDAKPVLTVYPNPVTGRTMNLVLKDVPAGIYTATLYDLTGQAVLKTQFVHGGGAAVKDINVGNIIAGNYRVVVTGDAIRINTLVIKN